MAKYVYRFSEGDKDQKDLLGGKGANLAEMTNLGMPVPPGFTISTDACRAYLSEGKLPRAVKVESTIAMRRGRGGRRAATSATRTSRCWCPCARGRSSRCRG